MLRLIREARRRRVFRVAGLYVVAAWVLLQVADVLFPGLGIPETAITALFYALLLGFPVALVFGWMFDIGPGGLRRTVSLEPGREPEAPRLRLWDYVILTAFASVLAIIAYNATREVLEAPQKPSPSESAGSFQPLPMLERSIAVMPFANLSADPENEFFSNGVAEEIMHRLASVGDLNVIGRTSSFAFRDKEYSARQLSAMLGVHFLLEGSVRKAGERIRITVQLLDEKGVQVWGQNYDRELSDIFTIQSEVASLVAERVSPRVAPPAGGEHLPDMKAYEKYLTGRELLHRRLWARARGYLDEAIALDPEFAAAYAELAISLLMGAPADNEVRRAGQAIDTALELRPGLVRAEAAQGLYFSHQGKVDAAEAVLRRAVSRDPNDSDALLWFSSVLGALGRDEERSEVLQRAARLDPLHPTIARVLAEDYIENGQSDRAEALYLRLINGPQQVGTYVYWGLMNMYHDNGRLVDMLDIARREALSPSAVAYYFLAESYALLGEWEASDYWARRTRQDFPDFRYMPNVVSYPAAWEGRYDDALGLLEDEIAVRNPRGGELNGFVKSRWVVLLALTGEYRRAIELNGPIEDVDNALNYPYGLEDLMTIAWAHGQIGETGRAGELTRALDRKFREIDAKGVVRSLSFPRYLDALNTLLMGQEELAMDRLQLAIDAGWSDYYLVRHDPRWDPARGHPRFQALMEGVKRDVDAQRAQVKKFDAENDFIAQVDAVRAAERDGS